MKIAHFCVFIAGLLPLLAVSVAKWKFPNYDNHNPRAWESQLTGHRARANAAQMNSFEAFPFFAAAVILAILAGVDAQMVDTLSVVFVLARLAYIFCYIKDWATQRSICWTLGYGCVVALFIMGLST
jgi:uncharacterized MAPEG superfamily protein